MPREARDTPQVYTYRAHDDSGRVISGTTDALSKDEIVRRLAAKGYTVDVVEGDPRTEEERVRDEAGEESLLRVSRTILDEALKQQAESVRARLPRGERTMTVSYLLAGTWHDVMAMPSYAWPPLRAHLAQLAGVKLSYGVAREPGRISCSAQGGRAEFSAIFRRHVITLSRV